jgi:hypothetical protein
MALQMTFKAINDFISPNSFILTLLVYGAYLRITKNDPLLLTILQRAIAIKKAIVKV